ncbi:Dynamin central region family protein [Trichomonas vaginalis G3]|uniref:Dynamin central region family protein n=1 Tax=Trichomonas vaginalis (strain ATCC PRA-98 / G3) TaxID=412133 RepID=A2DLJ8_TRIV3|nr:dynamin family [Trichomonas vaginalis G3]EAY18631.1 Dynamin central region family protein [Trichomonas vaginalis G3]KAI5522507.1 dynamin family [Trichomonas vaginalis G3]|eukprot:XP_001579617.1 Dynamin central region family protein [Trichomonas vaginalis G3]
MENLIPIVNDLQNVFNTIEGDLVDLPQIVVVGCQSSGKSSVLESIVGRDFLPRGAGIVTRRPLVLQLVHVDPEDDQYAMFLHQPGKKYTRFAEIRDEISAETDRSTGTGKNVTNQPINLTIRDSSVPNLTMVDLPGLTKVAVEGQDPNIVEMIHTMVLQFITKPNSLILAVTPANQDLANSDSLKIAREVDPNGERTIGVITKIDLMDAGTDAGLVLRNEIYPLKLGYIGVINRSQKDIDNKRPMKDAMRAEMEYFESHPIYKNLLDRVSTKVLSNTLNRLLVDHIKKSIPGLKTRVTTLIQDKERELERYGEDPTNGGMKASELILTIIQQYVQGYEDLIEGKVSNEMDNEVKGGARILRIFQDQYEKAIMEIPPISAMDINEVMYLMRNQAGITVPIYVSHQAFESLIRRQIEKLRPPAMKAINLVANEILQIHANVNFPELERYPQVKDAIRNVVEDLVNGCVEPSVKFINDVMDNEKIFVNTTRHDFRGAAVLAEKKLKEDIPIKKDKKTVQKEQAQQLINLASRYFELCRTQIVDVIPKTVVMMLVDGSRKSLSETLFRKIYGSGLADELLKEDPRITKNRKKCVESLAALRKASEILSRVGKFRI